MKLGRRALLVSALMTFMHVPTHAEVNWQSPYYRDAPLVGRVFTADGTTDASLETIKQRAARAKYVLLGEIHPNPDHHRLQAEVLQYMVDQGRKPAVVFEMVTRAQQSVLDNISANPPADLSTIADLLEWTDTGWPDFAMYQPLFEITLKNGLTLLAGNIEKSTVRRLGGRVDAPLSSVERAQLGLDVPLDEALNSSLLRQISEGHCNMMPEKVLPLMADIQRARDFTMAAAMTLASNRDGAVLIAGAGHTRLDWGVGRILGNAGSSQMVSVAFAEMFEGATDKDFTNSSHNYTMITPRFDVTDHCARFEKRQNAG